MPRLTPVSWKTLDCIARKIVFELARHSGTSHRIYIREGTLRPIVIPTYDEIRILIIKSFISTAGITRQEYFDLLKNASNQSLLTSYFLLLTSYFLLLTSYFLLLN